MNALIEFGTNYGNIIETGLLAVFISIVVTTTVVALKETK